MNKNYFFAPFTYEEEVAELEAAARVIKRGEIYWCEFDYGTGSEQKGTRPVVIVSNNKCNECSPIITVVPLTAQKKKPLPTHATVHAKKDSDSTALCEQMSTVDKDRIGDYINTCTDAEMSYIERCIKIQLGMYESVAADDKKNNWDDGIKVVGKGYRYFRRRCDCCGAVYQYTIRHANKNMSTACPECDFVNAHSAELGVECVENDG